MLGLHRSVIITTLCVLLHIISSWCYQVFELGGDVVPDEMAYGVMRLIAEGAGQEDPTAILELRTQAVASYLRLLHKPNLPDVLLKVCLVTHWQIWRANDLEASYS